MHRDNFQVSAVFAIVDANMERILTIHVSVASGPKLLEVIRLYYQHRWEELFPDLYIKGEPIAFDPEEVEGIEFVGIEMHGSVDAKSISVEVFEKITASIAVPPTDEGGPSEDVQQVTLNDSAHYSIRVSESTSTVELWSTTRLPFDHFEPKNWVKEMRDELRLALKQLSPLPNSVLHAEYIS